MKIESISPLAFCPYGKASVVRYTDGTIKLTSYETDVVFLTPDGWLTVTGLYSTTTRKHIMAFLREYAPTWVDFSTVKSLVVNGYKINLYTGEILRVDGKEF